MWPLREFSFQRASVWSLEFQVSMQLCPEADWCHLTWWRNTYEHMKNRRGQEKKKHRPEGWEEVKVLTFYWPSLLSGFGRVRAVDPSICFAAQEGLFDAEGLTGAFRGGLWPAAGCAVGGEKSPPFKKKTFRSRWPLMNDRGLYGAQHTSSCCILWSCDWLSPDLSQQHSMTTTGTQKGDAPTAH